MDKWFDVHAPCVCESHDLVAWCYYTRPVQAQKPSSTVKAYQHRHKQNSIFKPNVNVNDRKGLEKKYIPP